MGKASINVLRGRLYLLARLPRKNGAQGSKPQRIPTGLYDTPADHKIADKRRALLQRQIDQGTFCWDDWQDTTTKGITWRQAIDALYRKRVVLGRTGESTWQVNYMGRLRQLPMNKEVTANQIITALSRYSRDQCSYKELYYLLKDICSLTGIPFPEVPVPTYSKRSLTDVPEDHEIIEWVERCSPELGWALGMIAVYGLRPHELDGCQFIDDKHRLKVPDDSKTGFRLVIPLPPDWVEAFDLRNERRRQQTSSRKDATAQWLYKHRKLIGLPFKPYSFRHAYAGRLWRHGGSQLDIYTAARLMGHSIEEHTKTYREFIAPFSVAEKAEEMIAANLSAVAQSIGINANGSTR